jgi:hypothetical protein
MVARPIYYGQIPRQRSFYGKRYYHHTHSTDIKFLEESEKEFRKVMGDKYAFHKIYQDVIPPGTHTRIKMHVLYTRQK